MHREPGMGAIEFAREFVVGMSMYEAKPIVDRLVKGQFSEVNEKLVKKCEYCGYYFRDKRSNKAKVCCSQCRADMDVINKRKRRQAKAKPKVKKTTDIDLRVAYAGHLEYPFYGSGDEFIWMIVRKNEIPMKDNKIEHFGNKERLQGRRKPKYSSNYNGDGIEPPRVKVRFSLAKVNRKSAEVVTTHMTREEIEAYFLEKYGKVKLKQERMRATTLRKWV